MSGVRQPRSLTIVEGPDGAGKSTLARQLADQLNALYVHLGPFPGVTEGLGALYVQAMLPALLGYQNVVLDRSWHSEPVYGQVLRGGANRLGEEGVRMLDRLALRCRTVLVRCLPPWPVVRANWAATRPEQLASREAELRAIYDAYRTGSSDLPEIRYDYTRDDYDSMVTTQLALQRSHAHALSSGSAGNLLTAPVMLVGETLGEVKNHDALFRWPFGSFSGAGCSRWLTRHLAEAGIGERLLLWCNADEPDRFLRVPAKLRVALGGVASARLAQLGLAHETVPHPQYWKHFQAGTPYPLGDLIRNSGVLT